MISRFAIAVAALCAVGGCTIPRTGGFKHELAATKETDNFVLHRLDAAAVMRSQATAPLDLPDEFKSVVPPRMGMLSPGDRLVLTIVESTGVTVPSAINGRLDVDPIQVDAEGQLTVPYAGTFQVSGQSVEDLRRVIQSRLENKLYRPQVVLRKVDEPGNTVSILGATTKGGSFALGPNMQRLADLVGASGVEADYPEQVRINLSRGNLRGTTTLQQVLENPSENVALRPGDLVTVNRTRGFATVIGAAGMPGRVELTRGRFSILDAIASSRGLNDNAADPVGIFLFSSADRGQTPAVVYQIDITDPQQVQLARNYHLADGDLIYVSAADFAQVRKVLSVLSSSLGTVSSY